MNDSEKQSPEEYERMPASLRTLEWQRVKPKLQWYDGSILLAAVQIIDNDKRTVDQNRWHYEFDVVTVRCDENYFELKVNGETWDWSLDDISWYVLIKGPKPIKVDNEYD